MLRPQSGPCVRETTPGRLFPGQRMPTGAAPAGGSPCRLWRSLAPARPARAQRAGWPRQLARPDTGETADGAAPLRRPVTRRQGERCDHPAGGHRGRHRHPLLRQASPCLPCPARADGGGSQRSSRNAIPKSPPTASACGPPSPSTSRRAFPCRLKYRGESRRQPWHRRGTDRALRADNAPPRPRFEPASPMRSWPRIWQSISTSIMQAGRSTALAASSSRRDCGAPLPSDFPRETDRQSENGGILEGRGAAPASRPAGTASMPHAGNVAAWRQA